MTGVQTATRKIRVAAYCRVSTQSEQQETSFEAQRRFYTERIQTNPTWQLAGIYADAGITGTNKNKRRDFMRLIADCEAGKIDYVITKSISRFARNTLDCIAEVRHLQSLGINIYFEENNLDTSLAYSEMLLTVLAAFAQEESRSLSENVKWSIRNGFKVGRDRWTRIFGYTKTAAGKYQVVEQEAAVVRRIFAAYEKGHSMSEIGKQLQLDGVLTPCEKVKWDVALVGSILENEKYAGDVQLQKFYTSDHLSHRIVANKGEVAMPYLTNHHSAIISKKTFRRVGEIRAMNNTKKNPCQYPFGKLLICPHCGQPLFQRKLFVQHCGSGWSCEAGEKACCGFVIRSCYVERAVLSAYNVRHKKKMDSVEYWWLDERVQRITFGLDAATKQSGNSLTVEWKNGETTRVYPLVDKEKEHPEYVARLYWAWVKRKADGTLGAQQRTKGSRVVNGRVIRQEAAE